MCVPTVEWRLWRTSYKWQVNIERYRTYNDTENTEIVHLSLPGHRAFHTALSPDTTSPQCCHMAASLGPLEPDTVKDRTNLFCAGCEV